jgi:iron-sulfur cluster insertion protein
MAVAEVFTPIAINVTARAAAKVRSLVEEEENPELRLRVFVTGGGCSGFQYRFAFEDVAAEDDTELEKDGIKVIIDSLSFQYLVGSEIDYSEGLEGSRFVINNPNATTTCGCGETGEGRFPDRWLSVRQASQANAAASTQSGSTPRAAVVASLQLGNNSVSRSTSIEFLAPPPHRKSSPPSGRCVLTGPLMVCAENSSRVA